MDDDPDLALAGLSVWVLRRERPESDEHWDANWLYVRARVEASGSYVETSGPWLRNDELIAFADQLDVALRELKGSAELRPMEPMLAAKVDIGIRGEVTATIEITPDPVTQSHLFVFSIDQSYLMQTLTSCRQIISRFPLQGTRRRDKVNS